MGGALNVCACACGCEYAWVGAGVQCAWVCRGVGGCVVVCLFFLLAAIENTRTLNYVFATSAQKFEVPVTK